MPNPIKICSVHGCYMKQKARTLCQKHYARMRRTGRTDSPKRYRDLQESWDSRLQLQGDCLVWTGPVDANGYGAIWHKCRNISAHRYAWERQNGPIPDGVMIDHICHNPPCVNPDHLRLATPAENNANRSGPIRGSRSGHRNVYMQRSGRWFVAVRSNRKLITFGTYDTIEEAAAVAEKARNDLFGDYAGQG